MSDAGQPTAAEPQHTSPDVIDLSGLYVPLPRCEVFRVGSVDAAVVRTLEAKGYDHAPVTTGPEVAIGIIATSTARRLLEANLPLEPSSPEIDSTTVPVCSPLDALLGVLSNSEAVLVDAESIHQIRFGVLTLSDLNRHLFRAKLYQRLAQLEARLAHTVENHFHDPWEWLEKLSEDGQAVIVGRWEILKRRGLDVGPVVAANLPHLLNVAGRSTALRQKLDFPSRKAFEKATGHIPDIRNSVMHLSKPLILCRNDVANLRDALRVMARLCHALGKEELYGE